MIFLFLFQAVRWHARLRTVQASKRPSHDGVDSATPGLRPPPLIVALLSSSHHMHSLSSDSFFALSLSLARSLSPSLSLSKWKRMWRPTASTPASYAPASRATGKASSQVSAPPLYLPRDCYKVWLSKFFDMYNNIMADLAFFLMSKLLKTIPQVSRSFMSANCIRLRLRNKECCSGRRQRQPATWRRTPSWKAYRGSTMRTATRPRRRRWRAAARRPRGCGSRRRSWRPSSGWRRCLFRRKRRCDLTEERWYWCDLQKGRIVKWSTKVAALCKCDVRGRAKA